MLKRETSIGKNAWERRGDGCKAQQAWKSRKIIRMGNWKGKGKLKAYERGLSREKKIVEKGVRKILKDDYKRFGKETGKVSKKTEVGVKRRQNFPEAWWERN